MTLSRLAPLLMAVMAACGNAQGPPPSDRPTASSASPPGTGPKDGATTNLPAGRPRSFSVTLVGNFGDSTEARIIDRTGLVTAVEPSTASRVPVEPHLLPAVQNPPAAADRLVVFWSQVRCRTRTDVSLELLSDALLITIAPVGHEDCDSIGSTFELRLSLFAEVDAAKVAVRLIREGTGDIDWSARSPNEADDPVQIRDAALALSGAQLDVPARLAVAANGTAVSRQGRSVTIAWEQPCGSDSHGEITGTPIDPVLTIGWVSINACPGTTVRQMTLHFVEEAGAAALGVRLIGEM